MYSEFESGVDYDLDSRVVSDNDSGVVPVFYVYYSSGGVSGVDDCWV